jgi:uncharacterized membrane protein
VSYLEKALHQADKVTEQLPLGLDKVTHQATDLVAKAVGAASRPAPSQSVTIARPREEVMRFWRDPETLSAILGDIADVTCPEPGVYRWVATHGDAVLAWTTTLVAEGDRLRFSGGESMQIRLDFADAPGDRGTEVTLRATTPLPDFLVGPAAFTLLYRARALLQTGETPTLTATPAARK